MTASPWIAVRKPAKLRSMIAWILSADRSEPVIAVSSVAGSDYPVLTCAQVRRVVGAAPRVYELSDELLLGRLEGKLGPRLALRQESARVWWPGFTTDSDTGDHPLLLAMDSGSSEEFLKQFARAFYLTRPLVKAEMDLVRDMAKVDDLELARARRRTEAAEARALTADRAREKAQKKAEKAQARAREIAELPIEEQLHLLIVREWLEGLTIEDRRRHPLRYILSPQFVQAVESQPQLRIERVAGVCSMVACGCAEKLAGLEPHQLLSGAQGSPQIERADGAKAWRCRAVGAMDGGPQLHYWRLPDQTIEFDEIGGHDAVAMR